MLHTRLLNLLTLTLAATATLALTCCSTRTATPHSSASGGPVIVDTFTTAATISGIDAATHEFMLVTPNGRTTTYKAGPWVVNFNQMQIGDQVQAVLTEEVAASIGQIGTPIGTSSRAVVLAPAGAESVGVPVQTTEVVAGITAVDFEKRKVTFQLSDGTTKTVKAGKNVDLTLVGPGDNVTIQLGEGLVVIVEKS